ncbi:MAG: McrC family protein [Pseudomonadota bacterium]
MRSHVVREHAWLCTGPLSEADEARPLDRARILPSAFDWLVQLNQRMPTGARLLQTADQTWLKLDNYVGFLQTPCGTTIEILPKHFESGNEIARNRRLLKKMILAAMDLRPRVADIASLESFDQPLTEWLARNFLQELDLLVRRGVRFQYQRVEEEQKFLRGQLDFARVLRQPPGRQHVFPIRHDVHLPSRPENRLLRSALDRLGSRVRDSDNWRRTTELRSLFSEVPGSEDIAADFRRWADDRLMAHYQAVRPWCQLVLQGQVPLTTRGDWQGMSLLFPMEKLFERFVVAWLRRRMMQGSVLAAPAASEYLCIHKGKPMFRLEPDLVLRYGDRAWVLDAKWKRLDVQNVRHYGLSQGDFYQLFAYGHRYLDGRGDLFLVYPRTEGNSPTKAVLA